MKSAKNLRGRIKTAKNIAQITRAMEMVAASKMKRAQEAAVSGRDYSEELGKVIKRLADGIFDKSDYPLFSEGSVNSPIGVVIFSTDKGLCGSLNTNIFYSLEKFKTDKKVKNVKVVTIGKKGADYATKTGLEIEASFKNLPDRPKPEDVSAIAKLITDLFISKKVSEVYIVYPSFISTLVQRANIIKLLPLSGIGSDTNDSLNTNDYSFEPSSNSILNSLVAYYLENRLFQLLLETKASEHSSRMISMRNASQSASDLMDNLKLMYNRTRQSRITSELLDAISSRIAIA